MIKADINDLRSKIIKLALLQHHKIYEHGSHGPNTFDCAGLVWYVYHTILGIDIYLDGYGESTSGILLSNSYGIKHIYDEDSDNKAISLINEGDIVFLHRQSHDEHEVKDDNKYPGHCGIYLGDNRFIHASGTKKRVIINRFTNGKYWYSKLVASKDLLSDNRIVRR